MTLPAKFEQPINMRSLQIVPRNKPDHGTITFFLATGADRHTCRLATTFSTQRQALSYLQKHRTEFERQARARLASGEVEDGIVVLSML